MESFYHLRVNGLLFHRFHEDSLGFVLHFAICLVGHTSSQTQRHVQCGAIMNAVISKISIVS